MKEFSPETLEALGYYVYALVDPRPTETVFYVGKGVGQRCFAHARQEPLVPIGDEPNPKLSRIRQIREETGAPPPIRIVAHGLSEDEAFKIEAILIAVLNTEKAEEKGNLVRGKYADDYFLSTSDIESRYARPLLEAALGHRVLLVNLNGNAKVPAYPGIADADLDGRVLGKWRISDKNAAQVEYVIGVYRMLTKVVFKVEPDSNGKTFTKVNRNVVATGNADWRRIFHGSRDLAKEELWGSRRILNSEGQLQTKFARQQGCKLVGTHS